MSRPRSKRPRSARRRLGSWPPAAGGGGREGRAQGQIGEEQLAGGGGVLAAGVGEFAVQAEQAQGLVGLATGELVEIVADGCDAAGRQTDGVGRGRHLGGRHFAEQPVELFGELGQAVEAHDGQGAVGLVQVGLGELDATRTVWRVAGLGERAQGPFEGQVDFAFDPGQRTQVEFMC